MLGSHLLMSVLGIQVAFSVVVLALLGTGSLVSLDSPALRGLLAAVAGVIALAAFYAGWRDRKSRNSDQFRACGLRNLIDGALHPRQEWWWSTNDAGTIMFSGGASLNLFGYAPCELEGQPSSMVINPDDLIKARRSVTAALTPDGSSWAGVIVRFRHRDGTPVWMELCGRARTDAYGVITEFEGSSKPLLHQSAKVLAVERTRKKIEQMLREQALLTAFQPIRDLATGSVIGAEALARVADENGGGPEQWFTDAATVGLTAELEFAALESALTAAAELPAHLYVALNVSPETCLDPRLAELLAVSGIAPDRLVLELTEHLAVADYAPLVDALAPLRSRGLRIAVDDAGAGFASMRHILHLHPDIIKLDRSLIAGINYASSQRALGAAMVEFAHQIGAQIVAEGIESEAELNAVARLGMNAGQGYLLDRATSDQKKWAAWEGESEQIAG